MPAFRSFYSHFKNPRDFAQVSDACSDLFLEFLEYSLFDVSSAFIEDNDEIVNMYCDKAECLTFNKNIETFLPSVPTTLLFSI